ncbi:hypothetical protein BDB01DRAFT_854781 [Pilobolus umbonatus]|nr:hypothetical protein BDB01DRAFT_854781 [Pilobolus umbonatus]
MDLRNLLNTPALTLSDLQRLVTQNSPSHTLARIEHGVFDFPKTKEACFEYFDTYLRLLIQTDSIVSLRSCMTGLVKVWSMQWIDEFPDHLSVSTWVHLHPTLLVYLYGLCLMSSHQGMLAFIRSNRPMVVLHLWLRCCQLDDEHPSGKKKAFLDRLEAEGNEKTIVEMCRALDQRQVEALEQAVDKKLGNAVVRSRFNEDEFVLGGVHLDRMLSQLDYPRLNQLRKAPIYFNPLLDSTTATIPSDSFQLTESIRHCVIEWKKHAQQIPPSRFIDYILHAIQHHYPSDQKTLLDFVLADWVIRFPDTMTPILRAFKMKYNKRSSPYYAFIQLLHPPEERIESYRIKSGAHIDLSSFQHSTDKVWLQGCLHLLQELTVLNTDWLLDCTRSTHPTVLQPYFEWIIQHADHLNTLSLLLKDPHVIHLSATVVPVLLRHLSDLEWLCLQKPTILVHYFSDGPQVSKHMLVHDLLTTKPKVFMDTLFHYLRHTMPDVDPKSTHSRIWFQSHFLGKILELANHPQSLSSRLLRQFFKTTDDFEWYFATPLDPNPVPSPSSHTVYSVQHTGLASLLQELKRLDDTQQHKVVEMWFDVWIQSMQFRVPVKWILLCIGLYDQAPALVKQKIETCLTIGTPDPAFRSKLMDLLLISDMPAPEDVFDLITHLPDLHWLIIQLLIEVSEEPSVKLKKRKKTRRRKLEKSGVLVQRILAFLVTVVQHPSPLKHALLSTPLFYEPLKKLVGPEDEVQVILEASQDVQLNEDGQIVVFTSSALFIISPCYQAGNEKHWLSVGLGLPQTPRMMKTEGDFLGDPAKYDIVKSLDFGYKYAHWSPSRLSYAGGCFLVVVTTRRQVMIYQAQMQESATRTWVLYRDITDACEENATTPSLCETTLACWSRNILLSPVEKPRALLVTVNKGCQFIVFGFTQQTGIAYLKTHQVHQTAVIKIDWTPWQHVSGTTYKAFIVSVDIEANVYVTTVTLHADDLPSVQLQSKLCHQDSRGPFTTLLKLHLDKSCVRVALSQGFYLTLLTITDKTTVRSFEYAHSIRGLCSGTWIGDLFRGCTAEGEVIEVSDQMKTNEDLTWRLVNRFESSWEEEQDASEEDQAIRFADASPCVWGATETISCLFLVTFYSLKAKLDVFRPGERKADSYVSYIPVQDRKRTQDSVLKTMRDWIKMPDLFSQVPVYGYIREWVMCLHEYAEYTFIADIKNMFEGSFAIPFEYKLDELWKSLYDGEACRAAMLCTLLKQEAEDYLNSGILPEFSNIYGQAHDLIQHHFLGTLLYYIKETKEIKTFTTEDVDQALLLADTATSTNDPQLREMARYIYKQVQSEFPRMDLEEELMYEPSFGSKFVFKPREKCLVCDGLVAPTEDGQYGICTTGHIWGICSATRKIFDGKEYRQCRICAARILCPTDEVSLTNEILRNCIYCLQCGGTFVNPHVYKQSLKSI